MNKAFGPERASRLGQRLSEIAGVPSLEALRALPAIDLRDDGPDGRLVLVIDDTLAIVLQVTTPAQRPGLTIAGQEVTVIEIRSTDL
jgi:hypothetical protein